MGGGIELPTEGVPKRRRRNFTSAEVDRLRADYRRYVDSGRLSEPASEMDRLPCVICDKAKQIGLTDAQGARQAAAKLAGRKRAGSTMWADKPHPRGFAGKRHGASAKETSRLASTQFWGSLTPEQREEQVNATMKAAIAKNGRIGPVTPNRQTTWKAGWREIADRRHYFRSRWEANYARYLQWLKERGDILEWEYEPETFWFEGIKRGVRSYLPDFRVHELNGSKPIHEVKGWMDARSKTTLKRMAKYHPDQTIILIREKDYKALSRFSALVEGWE